MSYDLFDLPKNLGKLLLKNPKYRPDIDGLRAIAVLAVLGFHAFPDWIRGGFIGVDVFFVVSGFLISTIIFGTLDEGRFSFSEFYARRIRRIFPSLLVVLAFSYALGWFLLIAEEYRHLGKHTAAGAGFISNFVLWKESGYFDKAAETKPLLHLWSLGIEEQFYLLWPLVIWLFWKRKNYLLAVILLLSISSFAFNAVNIRSHLTGTFYSPATRGWELFMGSVLAFFKFKGKGNALANAQSMIGVLLLSIGFLTITKETPFPGYWALLPTLGTYFIISATPSTWFNRKVLSNRVLVWFGLISFPLYLWHWPLLFFARTLDSEGPSATARAVILLISIFLAWVTYRLVERPLRFGVHTRTKIVALVLSMIMIGLAGYYTYVRKGLEFRFPEEVRALSSNIDFKWHSQVREGKCLLRDQEQVEHDISCIEKKRPLIALWGDSHAASLYPGLKHLQESEDFGIAQMTQSGCGPIFELEKLNSRANCNQVNQKVLEGLTEMQPEILLLHAAWQTPDYPLTNQELDRKFDMTLSRIKSKLHHSRIIVLGPVPRWKESPQKARFNYWRKGIMKTQKALPVYLDAIIPEEVDSLLDSISRRQGVQFISAIKAMCTSDGCISTVGNKPTDITAMDTAHLTKAGAGFLVKAIERQLFHPQDTH